MISDLHSQPKTKLKARWEAAKQTDISEKKVFAGYLRDLSSRAIHSPIVGVVTSLTVRAGQRIKKNQVLAEIKPNRPEVNQRIYRLRSIWDGVISAVNIDIGDYVQPSSPLIKIRASKTPAAKIMRIQLSLEDVVQLELDQEVQVKLGQSESNAIGRVKGISYEIQQQTASYPVEIAGSCPGTDQSCQRLLKFNSFGKVTIDQNQRRRITIPNTSYNPNQGTVFVNDNGTVKLAKVEVGEKLSGRMEVISGLDEGDLVIFSSNRSPKAGEPVDSLIDQRDAAK